MYSDTQNGSFQSRARSDAYTAVSCGPVVFTLGPSHERRCRRRVGSTPVNFTPPLPKGRQPKVL